MWQILYRLFIGGYEVIAFYQSLPTLAYMALLSHMSQWCKLLPLHIRSSLQASNAVVCLVGTSISILKSEMMLRIATEIG